MALVSLPYTNLYILLMLPPDPIAMSGPADFVFCSTQAFKLFQVSLLTCSCNNLIVPILNDWEAIILFSANNVNSVLPPPTSMYK